MYIGHKSDDGRLQLLKDHLQGVSALASIFAEPFSAAKHAERLGILHDAGKYSQAGQQRMIDPEHTAKVDHSTYGAKIAWEELGDAYAACAVAGHHGGIPDLGTRASVEGDGTLFGRIRKDLSGRMEASPFWNENSVAKDNVNPNWLRTDRNQFVDQFYTRMLFSCLVDADFLDTESFMKPELSRRIKFDSIEELTIRMNQYSAKLLSQPQKRRINEKRCEILQDCINAANREPGLFTLTVPTGGGKTISSLAFALNHAHLYGKSKVIYVIPYTSIIEQNAKVFREILGDDNVLEHHSGISTDESDDHENDRNRTKMLAAENWDAPVIVTTSVQFFESLYSNKPSKCRKLHNIANSVIIFDEAQMLPIDYLKPCIWSVAELVRHYRVTAVLCTATQPSLNAFFSKYASCLQIREICQEVSSLQAFFRRVQFRNAGIKDLDALADDLAKNRQVLCIVNTRKTAQMLYRKLPAEGSFHLSTWMTPEHRSLKLEEIRNRLKNGLPCRVVSTSLIEAGVDVDFPQVWREMAGLDSILQAAGRCNREGKRSREESEVILFSSCSAAPKSIQTNIAAADIALEKATNPDENSAIQTYFDQLYRLNGDKALDIHGILDMCKRCEFQKISNDYHLIESEAYTVYIPSDKHADDIEQLKNGQYTRELMRRLGRSAVSIYRGEWEKMKNTGKLFCLDDYSAILRDQSCYDNDCGLSTESITGIGMGLFEA